MRIREFQTMALLPTALLEGVWSCAKTKFITHDGVSPARFPLSLYAWQFRDNHRQEHLVDLFLAQTLKLLPEL